MAQSTRFSSAAEFAASDNIHVGIAALRQSQLPTIGLEHAESLRLTGPEVVFTSLSVYSARV